MLKNRKVFARDYRNRRIGYFLKELDLSEGRGTGFPIIYSQMEENGSPAPIFETDEKFTHFLTILPVNQEVAKAIAEILGITSDGVFWNIKKLKANGIIQRIGADRGGYWKIIN
jgi:ATP-dependent DNA helicase RecG